MSSTNPIGIDRLTQLSALQAINTALASLRTAATSFSTGSTWTQITATSSNTAFSVTADSTATQTAMSVNVTQSATNATAVISDKMSNARPPSSLNRRHRISRKWSETKATASRLRSIADMNYASLPLRMTLSENRFPSPIGVEDMLFGIMRSAAQGLGASNLDAEAA